MFLIQKIPQQQYQNRLKSKTTLLFLRLKISGQYAHILKIYKRQLFKNDVCWYFCQAHFMLFVLKPKEILLTRTKGR